MSVFQHFLGSHLEGYFSEAGVHDYIKSLRDNLHAISKDIESRNQRLTVPYTFMDPQKIPNSITI